MHRFRLKYCQFGLSHPKNHPNIQMSIIAKLMEHLQSLTERADSVVRVLNQKLRVQYAQFQLKAHFQSF